MNLGNPDERRVGELGRIVLELTGSNVGIEHRPLPPDDPTRRCPDITFAREALGWVPSVALEEGMSRTIEWFRSHPGGSGG